MLNRVVFIAIENFNRELTGKKLLAQELSNNGYTVFMGHKSIIRSLLNIFPQKEHIFIDKGVTIGSAKRITKLKKSGMFIFSFDEEALMQTDGIRYSRFNHEKDSISNIDGIFSWGPKHKELLRKIGYKENQIIKTGNPRFDIYKLITKKEKSKKKGKYILICSRFCMLRASEMQAHSEKFMKPTIAIYEEFLKLPKLIRDSDIKTPILIRPHPSEPFYEWEKATSELKNIFISSKGPLSNVFKDSILMIHNRSTSGIEAYFSGLPVMSFDPIELNEPPHPPKEFINSFADYVAETKKEVLENIKKILKGEKSSKNKINSVGNYLFHFEDLSYKKITEFIIQKYPSRNKNLKDFDFTKILFLIVLIYIYHSFHKLLLKIFDNEKFEYTKNKRGKFFKDKYLEKRNYKNKKISFCSVDIFFPG